MDNIFERLAQLAEKIGQEWHDKADNPQEDNSDMTGVKIADAIRATAPKWTTEIPTEPGWYWVEEFETGEIIIARLDDDGTVKAWEDDDWESADIRLIKRWKCLNG